MRGFTKDFMMSLGTKFTASALLVLGLSLGTVHAEESAPAPAADLIVNEANSLDELLENVRDRRVVESRENTQRERRFAQAKADQAKMLQDAKNERTREQRRSDRLETTFEENEIRIGDMTEQLDKRLGSLRELFGVLQQVAGDTRGLFEASLVSSEYPDRGEWLGELAKKMGTSSQLATISEMEDLWFQLQQEMTASGEITKFSGTFTRLSGEKVETDIVRVGAFALVGEGQYLQWDPDSQSIIELARQPGSPHNGTSEALQEAGAGELIRFSVDPTRGSLLALLIQAATWGERIGTIGGGFFDGAGGAMGGVIIWVGIFGVLLSLIKFVMLFAEQRKVNAQRANPSNIQTNSSLGRVLNVYAENKEADTETLELKLGEAILGETPKITKYIQIVQVISVVAPLMGLLGTVIGMIETFQAITLFGAGDPKTMAGGISIALMTTVLGLVVAIPTTFLYTIVNTYAKGITHALEEESAGIIAEQAERSGRTLGA